MSIRTRLLRLEQQVPAQAPIADREPGPYPSPEWLQAHAAEIEQALAVYPTEAWQRLEAAFAAGGRQALDNPEFADMADLYQWTIAKLQGGTGDPPASQSAIPS